MQDGSRQYIRTRDTAVTTYPEANHCQCWIVKWLQRAHVLELEPIAIQEQTFP